MNKILLYVMACMSMSTFIKAAEVKRKAEAVQQRGIPKVLRIDRTSANKAKAGKDFVGSDAKDPVSNETIIQILQANYKKDLPTIIVRVLVFDPKKEKLEYTYYDIVSFYNYFYSDYLNRKKDNQGRERIGKIQSYLFYGNPTAVKEFTGFPGSDYYSEKLPILYAEWQNGTEAQRKKTKIDFLLHISRRFFEGGYETQALEYLKLIKEILKREPTITYTIDTGWGVETVSVQTIEKRIAYVTLWNPLQKILYKNGRLATFDEWVGQYEADYYKVSDLQAQLIEFNPALKDFLAAYLVAYKETLPDERTYFLDKIDGIITHLRLFSLKLLMIYDIEGAQFATETITQQSLRKALEALIKEQAAKLAAR